LLIIAIKRPILEEAQIKKGIRNPHYTKFEMRKLTSRTAVATKIDLVQDSFFILLFIHCNSA